MLTQIAFITTSGFNRRLLSTRTTTSTSASCKIYTNPNSPSTPFSDAASPPSATVGRATRVKLRLPKISSGDNNSNGNNGNSNRPGKFVADDNEGDSNSSDDLRSQRLLLLSAMSLPSVGYLVAMRLRRSPSYGQPKLYLSHILLAINVLIFIFQSFTPSLLMAGAKVNSAIACGEYYRLLSPMFLHASISHLMLNSFSLSNTGPSVESWFGKRRFLFLYFASGISGNYLSYLCSPNPAVGASGAIFGLVGATGVMLARHRKLLGGRARRALTSVMYIVIVNFGMGMIPGSRIDNFGHFGGFLGGIAFSYLFGPNLQVRYSRNGRPIVYDAPIISQVQKDVKKRAEQAYRMLRSVTD